MLDREKKLSDRRVAVLATDGFEESELLEPKKALENAGASVDVISVNSGSIRSWRKGEWGGSVPVDRLLEDVSTEDYDALLLPGGVINADRLRNEKGAVDFAADFAENGKPIAVICHGSWLLVETGLVKGRRMTSWPAIQTDLKNAGVDWVDEEVVIDHGWVSSRKPDDIPAFNKKMIEEFSEGLHNEGGLHGSDM